jgi:hypothetical protein
MLRHITDRNNIWLVFICFCSIVCLGYIFRFSNAYSNYVDEYGECYDMVINKTETDFLSEYYIQTVFHNSVLNYSTYNTLNCRSFNKKCNGRINHTIFTIFNEHSCKLRLNKIPESSEKKFITTIIITLVDVIVVIISICILCTMYYLLEKHSTNKIAFIMVDPQNTSSKINAVMQNGENLQFMDHQTEYMCLTAVKQNGLSLKFVKTQTYNICYAAINQNGHSIQYVDHKIMSKIEYQHLWFVATHLCVSAITHIKYKNMYYNNYTYSTPDPILTFDDYKSLCRQILDTNPSGIQYMEKHDDLCIYALKQDGLVLKNINSRNITLNYANIAVNQNGLALQYINQDVLHNHIIWFKHEYTNICLKAINQNPCAVQFVDTHYLDPDMLYNIYTIVVEKDGLLLRLITTLDESSQQRNNKFYNLYLQAIIQAPNAIIYVPEHFKNNKPKKFKKLCYEAIKRDPYIINIIDKKYHTFKMYAIILTVIDSIDIDTKQDLLNNLDQYKLTAANRYNEQKNIRYCVDSIDI